MDSLPESLRTPLWALCGVSAAAGLLYLVVLSRASIRPPDNRSEARVAGRATRNTILLMASGAGERILFWGFWVVALRMLGPAGNGEYAFATNLLVYFAAATNFGLSTLLTREVSRQPERVRDYFGNALAVRGVLVVLALPLMLAVSGAFKLAGSISGTTLAVSALLAASLVPSAVNQTYASIYSAYERMAHRGAVVIGTSLFTIGGGLLALLAGRGVLGLGVVALVANVVTFYALARPLGFGLMGSVRQATPTDARRLAAQGLPLMLNELLASLFFQVDILIIQPMRGTEAVGKYNAAYKFVSAMSVISPAVVLPLFPALARAAADAVALQAWVRRAWRPMAALAAPAVVLFAIFGHEIVGAFWGRGFLPEGGDALSVLMWFLPFSFLNGLLQYVLISLDRLRSITVAFGIASFFNVVANVALLPLFGVLAAAYTTVASEILLLVIYSLALRGRGVLAASLPPAVRPAIAAAVMAAVALALKDVNWVAAAAASGAAYAAVLAATGGISRNDLRSLTSALRGAL